MGVLGLPFRGPILENVVVFLAHLAYRKGSPLPQVPCQPATVQQQTLDRRLLTGCLMERIIVISKSYHLEDLEITFLVIRISTGIPPGKPLGSRPVGIPLGPLGYECLILDARNGLEIRRVILRYILFGKLISFGRLYVELWVSGGRLFGIIVYCLLVTLVYTSCGF